MRGTIRQGVEADARAIAEVHVRSWQAAYRGQLPDHVLDGLSVPGRERGWRQALQRIGATKDRLWVAEVEGKVVGFVATGPTRDRDKNGDRTAEVYAIYLDPEHWGRGIGRSLFAKAVEEVGSQGFEEATLWVLETNARTRHFYETAGWHADGSVKADVMEGVELKEVRYRIQLS